MEKEKLSIFLSHSHADIDKVRKVRDILETLECEPLIFFLKCLDDDNNELEDFIKREIEKRSLFLYCRSANAEKSIWVKKELEYIRSFDKSRLYTVDIEGDFSASLLKFLAKLTEILKENRIFLSYSHRDLPVANKIAAYLKNNDFCVYDSYDLELGADWFQQTVKNIDALKDEGAFLCLFTGNYLNSQSVISELDYATEKGALAIPVFIGDIDDKKIYNADNPSAFYAYKIYDKLGVKLSAEPTAAELDGLVRFITQSIERRKKENSTKK